MRAMTSGHASFNLGRSESAWPEDVYRVGRLQTASEADGVLLVALSFGSQISSHFQARKGGRWAASPFEGYMSLRLDLQTDLVEEDQQGSTQSAPSGDRNGGKVLVTSNQAGCGLWYFTCKVRRCGGSLANRKQKKKRRGSWRRRPGGYKVGRLEEHEEPFFC